MVGLKIMQDFCPKCATWMASLTLGCLIMASTLLVYWSFLDYYLNPIDEILSDTYFSATPEGEEIHKTKPGESLYVNWHLNILRSCESDFHPSILNVNTRVVTILESHVGIVPSIADEVEFSLKLKIPPELLPGEYEYRIKGFFACNPIHKHEVQYPSVEFVVLESES